MRRCQGNLQRLAGRKYGGEKAVSGKLNKQWLATGLCQIIIIIIIIIINKVLIKVTLNKVIAGALYIVICG